MGSAVLVAIDIHTFHLAGLKYQRQEQQCTKPKCTSRSFWDCDRKYSPVQEEE